jgi:dTDP-4-dehydrorhamnose reductase
LTDTARVIEAVSSTRPDFVVNLAAGTDVDECERSPRRAYMDNTKIVENLAVALTRVGGDRFLVQISTDQVYDGAGPHAEDDVTLTNYYGFSKYAGELAAACVPSMVFRTNFFGRSMSPMRSSLSDWLVQSLKEGKPISVFDDVLFSPLSIAHLAKLINTALDRPTPGVFNLGSREGMSKADFCYALANVLGLSVAAVTRTQSHTLKRPAYRPKDMRMNCGRFERQFDMQLPTLQSEIESVRNDYDANS